MGGLSPPILILVLGLLALSCNSEQHGTGERNLREEQVVVDLATQAALSRGRLGARALGGTAGATPGGPSAAADRVEMAPSGRLDFYFRLPRAAALTLDAVEGAAARLRVTLRPAGGRERSVGQLVSPGGFQALRLPGERGRIVRLSVVAEGDGRGSDGAVLVRPAVRSPKRPPAAASARPAGRATARPPHVIVYLVDTLRADVLGAYGDPRGLSPAIDRFAERATLFEKAYAQSSWTRAAVASIFTGLGPRFHGANRRDDALSEDAETLAEILHRAGYRTAGFITNGNVGPQVGFAQGFGRYSVLGERDLAELHHQSDRVNERVFSWLGRRAEVDDHPLFLYIHTMDPHAPYAPPPAYRPPFAPRAGPRPSAAELGDLERLAGGIDPRFGANVRSVAPGSLAWLQALHSGLLAVSPERVAELEDLYAAEVAFNDASFGAFVAELERLGLYEDALVVFTADHGEEFFEHGGWEHGRTLYDEQLRIPLIVKFPGQRRGRSRADPAQQLDLLPTVVEVAGLATAGEPAGVSLVAGGDGAPRAAFSYLDLDGIRLESVVDGRYKLIVGSSSTPTAELYELAADPGETDDQFAARPTVAAYLEVLLAAHRASRTPLVPPPAAVAPRLQRKLKALGYLG